MAETLGHNGEIRFRVSVDEPTYDIEIVMRWQDGAPKEDLITSLAQACGSACEELSARLKVLYG